MSRIVPLALSALFLALVAAPLTSGAPQDDAGTGCDVGENSATATHVALGTYTGTLVEAEGAYGPDLADVYTFTVPEGPSAVRINIEGGDPSLYADLFGPDGYRSFGVAGWYDAMAVGLPAGDWLVAVNLYGWYDGTTSAGCDPGDGRIVPYTVTISVEPRDHVEIFDRPAASFQSLALDMPASSGAIVENRGAWRGNAAWDARAFVFENATGGECGNVIFERRANRTAVGAANLVRTTSGGGSFLHGTLGAISSEEYRSVRVAWGSSGTITNRWTAAWNGDDFSISFPSGMLAEMDAASFDAFATVARPGQTVLVDASLGFTLSGVTRSVEVDPGVADPLLSTPFMLERPGAAPEALTGPRTFVGDDAPAGDWRLSTERQVGARGPFARVIDLPWTSVATPGLCY